MCVFRFPCCNDLWSISSSRVWTETSWWTAWSIYQLKRRSFPEEEVETKHRDNRGNNAFIRRRKHVEQDRSFKGQCCGYSSFLKIQMIWLSPFPVPTWWSRSSSTQLFTPDSLPDATLCNSSPGTQSVLTSAASVEEFVFLYILGTYKKWLFIDLTHFSWFTALSSMSWTCWSDADKVEKNLSHQFGASTFTNTLKFHCSCYTVNRFYEM